MRKQSDRRNYLFSRKGKEIIWQLVRSHHRLSTKISIRSRVAILSIEGKRRMSIWSWARILPRCKKQVSHGQLEASRSRIQSTRCKSHSQHLRRRWISLSVSQRQVKKVVLGTRRLLLQRHPSVSISKSLLSPISSGRRSSMDKSVHEVLEVKPPQAAANGGRKVHWRSLCYRRVRAWTRTTMERPRLEPQPRLV